MTPGSLRYPRSLGFVGVLPQQTAAERIVGIDFKLNADDKGGSVVVAPSSVIMMLLGAGLGSAMAPGKFLKGTILGGLAGAVLASTLRAASVHGF